MRLLEVSDAFSFHSSLYFRMGVLRRVAMEGIIATGDEKAEVSTITVEMELESDPAPHPDSYRNNSIKLTGPISDLMNIISAAETAKRRLDNI